MNKVTVTGLAIALMTTTSALAQTAKFDESIAKAAAAKAAEKIGEIRGSIDYDQVPDMVRKEDLLDKPVNTSFLPQTTKPNEAALPPMTSVTPGVDLTVTGSIRAPRPKYKEIIVWEKFDRYGNPIK